MAKSIKKPFIDALLNRVDIIDVINSYLPLKKAGKNFQACCPFHNEKTPSFTVTPQKQFFYCFGCGAKGNAIRFLMDYEHLSFVDSVEKLAERIGTKVEYEHFNEAKTIRRKNLYDLLQDTAKLYEQNLFKPIGKDARIYLSKRYLDKEIISLFRLGYSHTGNNLQSHFGKQTSGEDLEKAGLLSRSDNGNYYDQFRGRLMFPIRDPRGRVIAFGARSLGDAKPKYLNSKETDVFLKRYVLYGLYETLQSSRKIEHLIIVEGYMDVIALQQNGVNGAVAALGTSLTSEHLQIIQKYTKKIFICFDGDSAGKKAAKRSMDIILPIMNIDLNIRVVFLPDNEDPDTLIRKIGKIAFMDLLGKGKLFSEFILHTLIGNSNLNFIEGRGEIARRTKDLFDSLPNSEYKNLLYQEITKRLHLDVYSLSSKKPQRTQISNHSNNHFTNYKSNAESKLIRLLLAFPEFANYVSHLGLIIQHNNNDTNLLGKITMLLQVNSYQSIQMQSLLALFDDNNQKRLQEIFHDEQFIEKINNDETIEECRKRLKIEFVAGINNLLNRLSRKIY